MTDSQILTVDYILNIINQKGIRIKDLAQKSDIAYANLNSILNKNRTFGDSVILKLSKALGVDFDDLKSPPKNFLEKITDNYLEERKTTYKSKQVETLDMLGKVPYFDVDVTAGNVQLFHDSKELATDYYSVPKEIQDVDFCFKVRGDSMYDKILPGAIVFVKQISDISIIEFGQVFVIVTAEQRMVKYVRRHPTRPDDMVLLRSHNNHYDDIDLPKEKITNLLLVKGYLNNYVL